MNSQLNAHLAALVVEARLRRAERQRQVDVARDAARLSRPSVAT